jgi:hypothetical protein
VPSIPTCRAARTTGPVTIDGGNGDDVLTVNGASGGAIAGGAGNDQIFTRSERAAASALRVSGGPGNDVLFTADHRVDGVFDPSPVSRHIIECGPGADRVTVDDRDVLGAGCAPAVTGLRTGGTLGRFHPAGVIAVPPLRLKSPSALRIEFGRPRPPSFTIPTAPSGSTPTTVFGTRLLPRARGTIQTNVRARPSVRAALRTRRAPVTRSNVAVRARRGGDETTLFVRGTLRPGRTAR